MKDNKILNDFKIYIIKKNKYFKKLFNLSKQQRKYIDDKELEKVNEFFEKKDEIIEKIEEIDSDNFNLIEDIKEKYSLSKKNWLNELKNKDEIHDNIYRKINDLIKFLKKYSKSENKNQQLMEEWHNNMGKELCKINKGIKTNKFYNKKDRIYSTFIDKKS